MIRRCPKCGSCLFALMRGRVFGLMPTSLGEWFVHDQGNQTVCGCAECGADIKDLAPALAEEIIEAARSAKEEPHVCGTA